VRNARVGHGSLFVEDPGRTTGACAEAVEQMVDLF